jgi:hypothetical protein
MNLKAKLYILKNPTFLLSGPSSFELSFDSYLSITVGSLSFLKISPGSSFVYLPPSSSVSLPRTAAALAGHVRHLRRPSAALHRATCPSLPRRRIPRPRAGRPYPLHVTPIACPSRASPPLTVDATRSAPPPAPCSPTCRSPAGRRRSFSPAAVLRARHANPAATELRRAATRAAGVPAPGPAQSHLLLDSERILEFLTQPLLRLHAHISLVLSYSDHHPHRTSAAPPGHRR